jgi:hypothetical protein
LSRVLFQIYRTAGKKSPGVDARFRVEKEKPSLEKLSTCDKVFGMAESAV